MEKAPSIIFIDEVDSVFSRRKTEEHEMTRRVKSSLLAQWSAVISTTGPPVALIAATNLPWDIDPGFLSRFKEKILCPLPSQGEVFKILQKHCSDVETAFTDEALRRFSDTLKGYAGRDLVRLAENAKRMVAGEILREDIYFHPVSTLKAQLFHE